MIKSQSAAGWHRCTCIMTARPALFGPAACACRPVHLALFGLAILSSCPHAEAATILAEALHHRIDTVGAAAAAAAAASWTNGFWLLTGSVLQTARLRPCCPAGLKRAAALACAAVLRMSLPPPCHCSAPSFVST